MKYLYSALIIILLATACNTATPTPAPTLPNPRPTQPPAPPPTGEVKRLESQPSLDAPVIAYNEIKEGALTEPTTPDEWVFNARAGERVNIVLNSLFDSYLELFDPDGELLASNDDSGDNLNSALFDVQLNKTGPYAIIVRGYDGQMGSYALALTGGHPTIGGGLVTGGSPRAAVLSDRGIKWRYQGQTGNFLTIKVDGAEGVDSFLSLYGPDGTLLASDDDSGGNLNPEIIDYQLPSDGIYTVRAHAIANTGLITLTLQDSAKLFEGGPLVAGKAQVANLQPGRIHQWTFNGEVGQVINLGMVSPEFDTFLELRDSRDVILAENDDGPDGTNSMISDFVLPVNDTFTVIARSLSNQESGDYEIILKEVKVEAGGGSLIPDTPTQASIEPGQIDTWTFDANAGTFATVKVASGQLDSYLELFGPDSRLLLGDDDSGGGLNATILNFPIPEDGAYQVVVKPARPEDDLGGVYKITLTLADDLDTTGQLEAGQLYERALNPGEQHTWTFEATEDRFVTVQMLSDNLDTYLSLYDTEGELLYVNDDFLAKQAVIANFIVPQDGEYRIVARAYSPEEEGNYTISLDISAEKIPVSAPADTPAKQPAQDGNN